MKSAAQVGMLLVVFVVLLVGGYALLGHNLFAPPTDRYYSEIDDAGGISDGTPVLMAGVNVGTVKRVQLVNPRLARMTLDLKRGTIVYLGTELVISQSLIGLGQTPVTLQPPDHPTGDLEPKGATLPGRRQGPLESFLPNGKETAAELTRTLTALRKVLENQKLFDRFQTLMASTQHTVDKFGTLADSVNSTLTTNRGQIDRAVTAAASAVQDVHRVTLHVAELVQDPRWRNHADSILVQLQTIERHTDDLVGNLNRLVNDPALRRPADQIAKNVEQITQTGKSIASNTEAITRNGVDISQNVKTVSQKAIALTDQANQIAANAIDIENRFKTALDKVGGFFEHAPSTKGFKFDSEVDLMRESDPGYWRTDITFDTNIPDGTLYAGIYDAFESNKFTVEIGHPFLKSAQYRYGIYASKPAVGVDFPLAKRLFLRADAWDINHPRLDLRARYDFGNGLTGWLGVDRVLHANAPTVGIGIVR